VRDAFEGLRRLDTGWPGAQAIDCAITQRLNGGSGQAEREFTAPLLRSPPGGNPGGTRFDWKTAFAAAGLTADLATGLQPADSRQRQHPLQDGRQADQHHEQLEKVGKPSIPDKLVDGPEANCADHANNQNTDQK
jgi:hypothetical protein